MATYAELLTASINQTLQDKMRVAVCIASEAVRTEAATATNHANRLTWAKAVFSDPEAAARKMMWAVLAQNASATLAAITSASDATVQTAVNNAVDVFATGA